MQGLFFNRAFHEMQKANTLLFHKYNSNSPWRSQVLGQELHHGTSLVQGLMTCMGSFARAFGNPSNTHHAQLLAKYWTRVGTKPRNHYLA
jgi:hypothetical protein